MFATTVRSILGIVTLSIVLVAVIFVAVVCTSYFIDNRDEVIAYFWNLDGTFQLAYRNKIKQNYELPANDPFDPGSKSEDERVLWAITSKDKSFLNQREQDLYAVVKRFIVKNQDKSEYEIVKAAYELVCEKARYDHHAADIDDEYVFDSASSYGALVDGITVCAGYAKAINLLCSAAGMECLYVEGDTKNARHAWNMVKINSNWYHLDATWDDNEGLNPDFTYFLVSDDYMKMSRSWGTSYPSAEYATYELEVYKYCESENIEAFSVDAFSNGTFAMSTSSKVDSFDFIYDYYDVDGITIRSFEYDGRYFYQVLSSNNAI